MAAAMAGGKGKKKKWSKGKSRDQVDNKVLFNKEQFERFHAEVPKMKLITVSSVVEKLKINGGLARRALRDLEADGKIRPVLISRAQRIYTRAVTEEEAE
jgi:small subunit ribosomal protein S25e